MANTIDFILTNAASELIAKVLAGKTLNFTRMAVGDGFSYDTTAAKDYTALVNEVLSIDITKSETLSASSVKITSAFKNTDAQKEFYYREVGLFAQDPDTGEEILYAYGNRNDAAELITPTGSSVVTKQLAFIISVGNSANVTFKVNAGVYALQEDLTTLQTSLHELNSTKADQTRQNELEARMNTFVAVGSTSDNAETVDIRIDDFGITHDSAGTMVRSRMSQLSEDFYKKNVVEEDGSFELEVNFINKAVNADGTLGANNNLRATNEKLIYLPYDCSVVLSVDPAYWLNYYLFDINGNLVKKEYNATTVTIGGKECSYIRLVVTNNPNTTEISTDVAKSVFNATITYNGILKTKYNNTTKTVEMEWGGIYYDTGKPNEASDNRIRTVDFVSLKHGEFIQFSSNILEKHRYIVFEYSTSNASGLIATHTSDDWIGNSVYTPVNINCNFVKVVFNHYRGESIRTKTLEDFSNSTIFYNKRCNDDIRLMTPPTIPNGTYRTDTVAEEGNSFVDYATVIGWWDSLVANYPTYVTKEVIGKDASGTYDLYSYTFKPPYMSYIVNEGYYYTSDDLPTVIIDAGIHGNEKPCVKALYNTMERICSNWKNDDILTFMRWNLRFVCVPVVNPYGFEQGGSHAGNRVNYNGVNLNRNFYANGLWENGDPEPTSLNYRGTSANSEPETQAINALLQKYKKNAIVYYNLHTIGVFSGWGRITAFSMTNLLGNNIMGNIGISVTKEITSNGLRYHNVPDSVNTYIGTVSDYTDAGGQASTQAQCYGIQAAGPELMYKYYDGDNKVNGRETPDASRLNVEYIVACIMNACRQFLK